MRFNLGRYRVEHINKNRKGKRQLISKNKKLLIQQPTSIQNYLDVFERLVAEAVQVKKVPTFEELSPEPIVNDVKCFQVIIKE